eukprot:803097-Rhodomonas_salina.1
MLSGLASWPRTQTFSQVASPPHVLRRFTAMPELTLVLAISGGPARARKLLSRALQDRACGAHNTKLRVVAFGILLFAMSILLSHIEEMRAHRYREDKLILAPALCAEKGDLFDPASRMCRMQNELAFASLALQSWANCDMSSAGAGQHASAHAGS